MKYLLTFPHGLAMKLGITPRFIPMLLAKYLNKIPLSAIRSAEVYANAVSKTPGPVSVSYEEIRFVLAIDVFIMDVRWPSMATPNFALSSKRSWKYSLFS
jgi:hypothetical protein